MNKLGILIIFILFIAFAYALTFEDKTQSDFDNGIYVNTEWNNTGIMLKYWNVSEQELPNTKGNDGYFDMAGNVFLLHMNNNWSDMSGEGNSGTAYNGATFTTGKLNNGGIFDGSNDYVSCGNDASLNIRNTLTIAAWVKPDTLSASAQNSIVGKYFGYWFFVSTEKKLAFLRFKSGIYDVVDTDSIIPTGTWNHVAVTYNNSATNEVNLYINGQLSKTASLDGPIDDSTTYSLTLGIFGTLHYWDGAMDEVAIWNKTLSEDEISEIYQRQKGNYGGGENGTSTSRIFDAGKEVFWNNLSYNSVSPYLEYIYALDNDRAVFRSSDYGVTWSVVNPQYYNQDCYGMTSDSNGNLYIASKDGHVFKSIDEGISWAQIASNVFPDDPRGGLTIDSNDNLYANVKEKKIYKSSDLGVTWSLINNSYSSENTANQRAMAVIIKYTNLTFQVRNCALPDCNDGTWQDVNLSNINLTSRYFQYKTTFTTQDSGITPELYNVTIDYTLPENNAPAVDFGTSTTSEGTHNNQDSINVEVELSDESQIYSFINFNNSLNAFYKLNDTGATIKDYSGNNYDGTINGAISADGKFGNSLYFDGTDTVDCAGAGNFERMDNFSVSVWVKASPNADGIIQRYDGTKGWSLFTTASGTLILDIRHDGLNYIRRRSVNTITDTTWKHIVFTYDGSSTLAGTHVYVDGQLDDSSSGSSDTLDNSISTGISCKLGILHNYNNYRWIGNIEEVLIFNRVLSSNEISALYSASSYSKNFTSLDEGEYNFYAYAQDVYGNENQIETRGVTLVNNLAPSVNIDFPINGANYSVSDTLELNFTANDSDGNLQSCWYKINLGENITLSGCGNTTIIASLIGLGNHTLIVYANDTQGAVGRSNVSFSITNTAPTITLSSPQDGASYGYNESLPLNFTVNDIDDNINTCRYKVVNSTNSIIINNLSVSGCTNTSFNLPGNDIYTLTIYVNDSYGLEALGNATFNVDIGAPTIILNSPINSYLNLRNVTFYYTPIDIDLQSCELWGDFDGEFKSNQIDIIPLSGTTNTFYLTLEDGEYLWSIKCNDSFGHSAINGNKTFYVDTVNPSINLFQPIGTKTSRTVTSSWSVFDGSPMSCKYNIYRGENIEVSNTSVNCFLNSAIFSITVDADFIFNFYVNDLAGNFNHSSTSFTVDTSTPPSSSSSSSSGSSGGGSSGGGSFGAVIKPKLSVGDISNIVVNKVGIKRIFNWKVKNDGNVFLNDCVFKSMGDYSGWVTYTETKGLAVGEEYTFVFDVNIPEDIGTGEYLLEVMLECQETNASDEFSIEVVEKGINFVLLDVLREEADEVKIRYSLEDISGENQQVEIQFLLFDLDGRQVAEVNDTRSILAGTKQEFDSFIPIDEFLEGELNLLINLNSETFSSFVQEFVILGSYVTGLTVFDRIGGKDNLISAGLVVLFLGFAFFIIRRISGHKRTHKEKIRKRIRRNIGVRKFKKAKKK